MSENQNEVWDLYSKDRERTGKTHRRGEKLKEGEYRLVVHACIFNEKNELLIQQRQANKSVFPNMWDVSASGCVISGETSSEAVHREVLEELGLNIDFSKSLPYFSIYFQDGFDDFYLITQENLSISDVRIQKEEVKNVRFASKDEVMQMKENGIFIPYYFLSDLFGLIANYSSYVLSLDSIEIKFATLKNIESWMSLIEIVRDSFPGLETDEKIEDYRRNLARWIEKGQAICATHLNIVVGALIFSVEKNMLCFMAVHPQCRRKKIATKLIELMLTKLDRKKDIVVETYREDDANAKPARALYLSLGFVPGELSLFENKYPMQKFVLKAIES